MSNKEQLTKAMRLRAWQQRQYDKMLKKVDDKAAERFRHKPYSERKENNVSNHERN